MAVMTMRDALNQALREELARLPAMLRGGTCTKRAGPAHF